MCSWSGVVISVVPLSNVNLSSFPTYSNLWVSFTGLNPNFVKIVAWYDNELGYTTQLLRMLSYMQQVDNK